MTEKSVVTDLSEFRILAHGLDHPEGVAVAQDGSVYAGGEAGQIYTVADGESAVIANTDGFVLGLCLDGDDNVYACDTAQRAVLRITPDGLVDTYASGDGTTAMVLPNYPVFDRDGNLFVSDSGVWDDRNGRLWVVRHGGRCEIAAGGLSFPNGLAISPDGRLLAVVLSHESAIISVPILDGEVIGEPEVMCELPGVVPDGVAFDQAGTLYIACYAPDLILTLSPEGELATFAEDLLRMTLSSPTNLAFAGEDRRTLVVASLGGRQISTVRVSVPGCELNYPTGLADVAV